MKNQAKIINITKKSYGKKGDQNSSTSSAGALPIDSVGF